MGIILDDGLVSFCYFCSSKQLCFVIFCIFTVTKKSFKDCIHKIICQNYFYNPVHFHALLHLTDYSGYLRNLFCKNCSKLLWLLLLCSLIQAKSFVCSECTELFLVCGYDSLLKYENNPFQHVESRAGVEEISLLEKELLPTPRRDCCRGVFQQPPSAQPILSFYDLWMEHFPQRHCTVTIHMGGS